MTSYKIYAGLVTNKGSYLSKDAVIGLVGNKLSQHNIKGATFYSTVGMWEGNFEESLVIELLHNKDDKWEESDVNFIASWYKDFYDQDAVLVTKHLVEGEVI